MLLSIENINVRYGRNHAVKNVSINLADGEIVTVLGANGAGKSSLLRCLNLLEEPTDGSIYSR